MGMSDKFDTRVLYCNTAGHFEANWFWVSYSKK